MKKIAITLPSEELDDYRVMAAQHNISISGLISALARHARNRHRNGDQTVNDAITEEAQQRSERRAEAGTKGMNARWGDTR